MIPSNGFVIHNALQPSMWLAQIPLLIIPAVPNASVILQHILIITQTVGANEKSGEKKEKNGEKKEKSGE